MLSFSRRRAGVSAICALSIMLLPQTALAGWASGQKPTRAESPASKVLEIPRFKNIVADPAGDTFGTNAVQLDIGQLSAIVADDDLVVTLGFFGSISAPDSGLNDAIDGFIDIDIDQDGTTGDLPWSDFLRPADSGETGMGNEVYVDILSFDNGQVEVVDDLTNQVIGFAELEIGNQTATFTIPLALLGGDDSVDVAAIIGTFSEATDVAPNQGSVASSDGSSILLQDDRFQVEVEWGDFEGNRGVGRLGERTPDSAVLYFFTPNNWELLVKVLDACTFNDHFWVFLAATTNVEFSLTVTDTQTGEIREYSNDLGQPANAITDTSAFATCP